MKRTHFSKKVNHQNVSIDLPSHKVWVSLEEYGSKSFVNLQTGLNFKQVEKAEVLLDKAFESILEKLVQQN